MRSNVPIALLFLAGFWMNGCAAVYPELKTPVHAPVEGQPLDPPPPSLKWIAVAGATVPKLTRDGRAWGAAFSNEPSPYAIVFVNGEPILRTEAEPNTFAPTWPSAPRGNFVLEEGDRIRVELWESRPVSDRPIGVRDVRFAKADLTDDAELIVPLEGGAELVLKIEAARPEVGLGFRYELRGLDGVFLTRVFELSPAGRAGLNVGDQVVAIDGRPTKGMSPAEIQSLLNMQHPAGFQLQLKRQDGSLIALTLKEGAIYSLYGE